MRWLKLPVWKGRNRGFGYRSGIQVTKKQHVFPRSLLNILYCGEPPEVASSASDRKGSNFESCVWRAASPHSHHIRIGRSL